MKRSTRTGRTAPIAAALVAFVGHGAALAAAPDAAPTALYQRFDVDQTGEWGTVSLRLDPQAWRAGRPDGPPATPKQWFAAIRAMKSMVIGADCAPIVRGQTTYPCSFSIARTALDDDAPVEAAAQGWVSTSRSTLDSPGMGAVSAVSTPHTSAPPASWQVDRWFVGLVAPRALRDKIAAANSRMLRVHLRCGSTPFADDDAKVGRGLLILTSEVAEPEAPIAPEVTMGDTAVRQARRARQPR